MGDFGNNALFWSGGQEWQDSWQEEINLDVLNWLLSLRAGCTELQSDNRQRIAPHPPSPPFQSLPAITSARSLYADYTDEDSRGSGDGGGRQLPHSHRIDSTYNDSLEATGMLPAARSSRLALQLCTYPLPRNLLQSSTNVRNNKFFCLSSAETLAGRGVCSKLFVTIQKLLGKCDNSKTFGKM